MENDSGSKRKITEETNNCEEFDSPIPSRKKNKIDTLTKTRLRDRVHVNENEEVFFVVRDEDVTTTPPSNSPTMTNGTAITVDVIKALLDDRLADMPSKTLVDNALKRMEENTREIRKIGSQVGSLSAEMAENNRRIEERFDRIESTRGDRYEIAGINDSKTAAFNKARCTLRIWPVDGDDDEKMKKGFIDFATNALQIEEEYVTNTEIDGMVRVRGNPNANTYAEIAVTFRLVADRDYFASNSRNLAGYNDEMGRPQAGVKMD